MSATGEIGHGLDGDAKAIIALDAWKKACEYNWAIVPQTSEEPVIVHIDSRKDGPVAHRILFFPGFAAYREYAILRQTPDLSLSLSPIDVTHLEMAALEDGSHQFASFRTGHVPRPANDAERRFLEPVLHECRGLMMRFEEHPDLPATYKNDESLFGRIEGLDGRWHDGPVRTPKAESKREERISLAMKDCAAAASLPFDNGVKWEVDLFGVPACRIEEPDPRYMYLFAAVDSATGERCAWDRMSVKPSGEGGLAPIWESLAQRLLSAIIRHGRIPGAVNVRSGRMARFLRPLGLQIPFRLVQHVKLDVLDSAVQQALRDKTI